MHHDKMTALQAPACFNYTCCSAWFSVFAPKAFISFFSFVFLLVHLCFLRRGHWHNSRGEIVCVRENQGLYLLNENNTSNFWQYKSGFYSISIWIMNMFSAPWRRNKFHFTTETFTYLYNKWSISKRTMQNHGNTSCTGYNEQKEAESHIQVILYP